MEANGSQLLQCGETSKAWRQGGDLIGRQDACGHKSGKKLLHLTEGMKAVENVGGESCDAIAGEIS